MDITDLGKTVTYHMELPGGQERLKEAAIYVMDQAAGFEYFGLVKLNKIVWRADFAAFLDRKFPVTGRPYQKIEFGPAAVEMKPILREMETLGWIEYIATNVPNEKRPAALNSTRLGYLSPRDFAYLDESLEHYRDMTATETSRDSHGLAWKTREIGQLIPYDAAIFDDRPLPQDIESRLIWIGRERHWRTA